PLPDALSRSNAMARTRSSGTWPLLPANRMSGSMGTGVCAPRASSALRRTTGSRSRSSTVSAVSPAISLSGIRESCDIACARFLGSGSLRSVSRREVGSLGAGRGPLGMVGETLALVRALAAAGSREEADAPEGGEGPDDKILQLADRDVVPQREDQHPMPLHRVVSDPAATRARQQVHARCTAQ